MCPNRPRPGFRFGFAHLEDKNLRRASASHQDLFHALDLPLGGGKFHRKSCG